MSTLTAVIVEDSAEILELLGEVFRGKGYGVIPVLYESLATQLPQRRFDVAVSDGLGGHCFAVLNELNAGEKILYSGDEGILARGRNEGLVAHPKPGIDWMDDLSGVKGGNE